MADYRLSVAAEDDLRTLYRSSYAMFGPRQTDLKVGLFRFRYQSHMVFYTIEPDQIVIQRVLHARMDFGSRL